MRNSWKLGLMLLGGVLAAVVLAVAQAPVNLAQLVGTVISVNSGNKDAGTLRVVLATDQPALTNKLLVTPDSVALPANQSVNAAASATAVGCSPSRTAALSNSATSVKASAGNVYWYHAYNSNSVDEFLQLYDVASGSVTVGTTTPTVTLGVPAGGVLDGPLEVPMTFATAITIAATTTITGGTAPSTGLLVNLCYK